MMELGRLEAFSDGVFAVAITLLALDLSVGGPEDGSLAHQLLNHWPAFVAYLISFFTIGVIWVNHHVLFAGLARLDRTMLFVNLLLMLFVVAIPFATATMAEYLPDGGPDSHLATSLYGVVMTGMASSFGLVLNHAIKREHMADPLEPAAQKAAQRRFAVGIMTYVGASLLAWVSASAAFACYGAVAIFYVLEQTPSRQTTKRAAAELR
jgi:uncharacterized membrane protein